MKVTPDVVRTKALQLDALLEAFEGSYLHFLDIGKDEPEERNKGAVAFYALRDMAQGIIRDMDELGGHMEVCDAVAAVAKMKGAAT